MGSARRLLVAVATALLVIGILAPSVAAHSGRNNFHLEKTCASDILCTVTLSSLKVIKPGTDITYTFDTSDPWDGLAFPTINLKHGSATGVCDWNQPGPTVLAVCTFTSGTGSLRGFHLKVDVTFDGTTWFWDGTVWFSHHHHHHHGEHH